MASPIVTSKTKSEQAAGGRMATTSPNDAPVTEEELLKKTTPIEVNDVLRLKKATSSTDAIFNWQKKSKLESIFLLFRLSHTNR